MATTNEPNLLYLTVAETSKTSTRWVLLHILSLWIFQISYAADNNVKFTVVGDISFAGFADYMVKIGNCTYNESFAKIKKYLKADYKLANLEQPFGNTSNPPKPLDPKKLVHLIGRKDAVQALKYLDINIVTLANNHLMDYGDEPMEETVQILKEYNIKVSGMTYGKKKLSSQVPVIVEKNDVKVGILSYCMNNEGCTSVRSKVRLGPAIYNTSDAIKDLQHLWKMKPHATLVYLHWGNEYDVMSLTKDIKKTVRALHPYTDVIVGSHAHVSAGHFYHNTTLVVKQLGNFLFPMRSTPFKYFNANKPSKKKAKRVGKLMRKYQNPSSFSKVLSLVFNKDGLDRKLSKYTMLRVRANKNNCINVERTKEFPKWITFCSDEDDQCNGQNDCNPLVCKVDRKQVKKEHYKENQK